PVTRKNFATPDSSPNKVAAGQAVYYGSHLPRPDHGFRYGSPAFRGRPMVKKPERYPDVILFPKAGSGPPPVSVWQQQKFPESHRLSFAKPLRGNKTCW